MIDVVPEFVKTATVAEIRGTDSLTPSQWADPVRMRYPIHTPAAIWTSAREAAQDGVTDPGILGKIASAAKLFHVDMPYREKAEFNPVTQTNPLFALRIDKGGKSANCMPINNHADVVAAGPYLQKYAGDLPYELRQTAAEGILKRADELGTTIDPGMREWLSVQAGRGEYLPQVFKAALDARAVLRPGHAEDFKKLATMVRPGMPRAERIKIAAALSQIDQSTRLHKQYGDHLLSPETALFGITHFAIKQAMDTHLQLSTGEVFEKAAIRGIPEQSLRDWLGDPTVDDVSEPISGLSYEKLAEALPILPKPDARRFIDCARLHGVQPVA